MDTVDGSDPIAPYARDKEGGDQGSVAFAAVTKGRHPLLAKIHELEAALTDARAQIQKMRAGLEEARSQSEHLEAALRHSRDIGAAIGIVMAQRKVTRDEAFALLSRASQHQHVKIRDLAVHVMDTGILDVA